MRRKPIVAGAVFYESFAGNGMLCNPEAIFRELRSNPEFAGLTHIWALKSKRENHTVVREFARDKSVRFVKSGSTAYYRALSTSEYLINNATFPPDFGKRKGQTYLNTWHGTPLKQMGYDIGDPASRVGNVIRNFLSADYLLAANRFMVDQMYESAHLLHQIYRGQIVQEGYPRIDHQFMTEAEVAAARARLEREGLNVGDRKIILYAPTWKGTNFNRPEDDADELIRRVTELSAMVDTEKYVVLLKTHQVVHKYASHQPHLKGSLVPNEIPTNTVLGVSDVLITDYSSIFFDFLATGRPILFFTPDIEDYAGYRGLYMEPETWPGPVVTTLTGLGAELNSIATHGRDDATLARYQAMRERFTSHEDGHATDRIIDIVFRRKTDGYRILNATRDDRPTILINAGSMRPNGITSSLLNLLDAIDHSRFDVSIVFPYSRRRVILQKQAEVNHNVRQFVRVGGMNGSKLTQFARRRAWRRGDLTGHSTDPAQRQMWDDEWTRCFGDSVFDYAIDFSGYGPFWATLMLHAPNAVRSIWQHNDMWADAHRETKGRRRHLHLRDVLGIFSIYNQYDHLVSVSPALRAINAENLSKYAPAEKFESTVNLVNAPRILANAEIGVLESTADAETGESPEWALELAAHPEIPTFVSVGRLSPEKNHARLIRAFAILHATDPNTRLFIVGSGPLRADLDAQIEELGLGDAVWMTGHQSNPHAIMASSNCFVLSSDYEGQPMVILEALLLRLPVVTVAFGSARDAMPAGVGLVVPTTDDDLADGMREFLKGTVSAGNFDPKEYNAGATRKFYSVVGLADASA